MTLSGQYLYFNLNTDPADDMFAQYDVNGVRLADSSGVIKTFLSNSYLNWSSTSGASGYGIRDNAGVVEAKDSGGAWGEVWRGVSYSILAPSASLTLDDDNEDRVTIYPNEISVQNYDTADMTTMTPLQFQVGSTYLTDDYLNFSSTIGTSGFGFRNSSGVMEVKDSGGFWQKIETYDEKLILGSDVTSTGTAYVDVTGMTFGYEANATYIMDYYILVTSAAATTGHGFGWNTTTAVTNVALTFYHQLATATGTLSGGSGIGDDNVTQAGVSSGVPGTGLQYIQGSGILISGANTGSAQFRKRSEVAANSTIKAGSVIIVRRIA
jgi:hypothetical protein